MNRCNALTLAAVQAFTLLLFTSAESPAAPFLSEWVAASDGNWLDGSKWSTAPNFPNNGTPAMGDTYSVQIAAAGTPYIVSLFGDIQVSDVTINSLDATLAIGNGHLETPSIHIAAGNLLLGVGTPGFFGLEAEIVGANITGSGTIQIGAAREAIPVFDRVTLGVDTFVPPTGGSPAGDRLILRNGLTIATDHTLRIGGIARVDGSQTINGLGELRLEGSLRLTENTMLTIGPELIVSSGTTGGVIGLEPQANSGLINEGLILATAPNRDFVIMSQSSFVETTFENRGVVETRGDARMRLNGNWTNHGVFRLRDNGRLDLAGTFEWSDVGVVDRQGGSIRLGGIVQNVGQTITANATFGSLTLGGVSGSPTQITGGTLASADGESWQFISGTLANVTVASDATMQDNSRLRVSGDLTLDEATISLFSNEGLSSNSSIEFLNEGAPQAIRGTGTIRFAQGRVNTIRLGSELTIGDNIVIESTQGHAELRNGRLINEGLIRSGGGTTLDLPVEEFVNRGDLEIAGFTTIGRDANSTWQNEGTIRIKSGGSLAMSGTFTTDDMGNIVDEGAARIWLTGVLDNTGRTLDLETLSLSLPLTFNGGTIRGGRVISSGDATLGFTNPGTFDGVTLGMDLTIGGSFSQLNVRNGLTLDDVTLTMPEGTSLNFSESGPQLLGGVGTIYAPNRPDASAITRIAGDELTIGEGITIRNGTEAYRELAINFKENRGTIIAEAPNSLVSIGRNISPAEGPAWRNEGVIRVQNGTVQFWGNYSVDDIGTLEFVGGQVILQGNILNEGKAIVQNAATGVWKLRGTVRGGRIETGDGVRADVAGTFDNVTLAGEAVLFDEFSSSASGALWIANTLTFDNGTLTIERFAELSINQHVTLAGTGQIVLNGTPQDSLIQTFTGGQVTIGPNIAVRTGPNGGGTISRSNLPVINQGTISAETFGQVLVVDGALQNTGLLQARDGATLRIDADNWTNQGTIHVEDGYVLCRSVSVVNGAGAMISGNGTIEFQQTQFTNQGMISPGASIGRLKFQGGLRLDTTSLFDIELAGTTPTSFDVVDVSGDVVLDGQLQVSLIDGFELRFNQKFKILNVAGRVAGEFDGLGEGSLVGIFGGKELFISYSGGDGNDVVLSTAVPEPACALLALAVAASVCLRGRLRTSQFPSTQ